MPPDQLLVYNSDRYDASLCMRNDILLEWNHNMVSIFVEKSSSKWSNACLVYSVLFDCATANVTNTDIMVGLTDLS